MDSVYAGFNGFSNVTIIQRQKKIETPIKTIKAMILKLSGPDGVTPANNFKNGFPTFLAPRVSFYWFSNVLASVCAAFIGFSNVSVNQKQKALETPLKAMILKPSRPDGDMPADSFNSWLSGFYWFF